MKAERQAVAWALMGKPRPAGPVRVLMVRISPPNAIGLWKPLDEHDNLRGSLKAPVDQVAAWLGRDDADPSIAWSYAQRRGAKGEWQVEILIEEVADA